MDIGFLGGTGSEARGLALRFALAGARVILGSRSAAMGAAAAEACRDTAGVPTIHGTDNANMIRDSELIFLTVPFGAAIDAVRTSLPLLKPHHILVDVTVPLNFTMGRVEYLDQEGFSNSEIIDRNLPKEIPLVGAFKTIPAAILADLKSELNCSVFLCGNSREAKTKVANAASMIPTLHAVDCGGLETARTLERMTALAIALNRRYKRHGARFRVVGLDGETAK
jgi:NADPH-dependent F420 reductase